MTKANTFRSLVQVYRTRQIGESPNNKGYDPQKKKSKHSGEIITLSQEQLALEENMTQMMTQRNYNQPKQQDTNLQIDSKDIEIDPYHSVVRDQGMTHLTEEENQKKDQDQDQDQEVIQDRKTIKVREKLEWTSIEIRMGMKPEANREVGVEEPFEEGIRTIKEENRATRIEINLIKKDTVRCKSATHILSRTIVRQRIHYIGIGLKQLMKKTNALTLINTVICSQQKYQAILRIAEI
ncbi:MAG: hypothetical protein EZS28_004933 [Streblomastix strix]|uniref:Uncharacterized protein n=1 Tax=Streblomastix strix TaxID=222440 RepID=A0A5J4WWW1_9EUKA|nr:MAG: hypothetical protein EZS28_004933 [Streblomastix strix]